MHRVAIDFFVAEILHLMYFVRLHLVRHLVILLLQLVAGFSSYLQLLLQVASYLMHSV